MAINLQDIITALGGQGMFLAAAYFLFRTGLAHKFARDAKEFEANLQGKANIEIERLKSSLQITTLEHQVRFSNLHERRAQVIAEVYERLVGVFWDGQRFVFGGAWENEDDRGAAYRKTLERTNEFALFVDTHRIYLPREVCSLLDEFLDVVRKTVIPVGVWSNIPFPNAETTKQRGDAVMSAYRNFETRIPSVRRALESEFRALLGDPTHERPDCSIKE